jgi:predicted AlkP superfamily phosphohydrolase/phosphomutase
MKTLILGLDAFDPNFFEKLNEQGLVPNLGKYVGIGGYAHFEVSNPPQSEVSWTSIATGLNPGSHGMFDFVHRDPDSYGLVVSLLPTKQGLGGTQFVRPYSVRTIFDQVADKGYPATALWWPATFPARPESPVRTIPGLGTPDILGRLGVGTLFTSDPETPKRLGKTPVIQLRPNGSAGFEGEILGPMRKTHQGAQETALPFALVVKPDYAASLQIGKQTIPLYLGKWSQIIELQFKVGLLMSIRVITRAILTQLEPEIRLYFLPLQLHPLHSPWRYGTPGGFVKQAWTESGPFLTIGWPQDTVGLEDGCIDDDQFLALCDDIFKTRIAVLREQIKQYNEGLLAVVFDSLDRIQHMFWRDRPDIIESWYLKLDALVGDVEKQLSATGNPDTQLIVVSDHGFANFNQKVHLNRWLVEQGYLSTKEEKPDGNMKDVKWSGTKAYAIGLNSLYLNLQGREAQGQVKQTEGESLVNEICQKLSDWVSPDGKRVVQRALSNTEAFEGTLCQYGPDILVGYAPGFRASQQTGTGGWEANSLEVNYDHWNADHCIDPQAVPGVIFANHGLKNFPNPSYRDIPALAINAEPDARGAEPPPTAGGQDQEAVEERLKSLGYL